MTDTTPKPAVAPAVEPTFKAAGSLAVAAVESDFAALVAKVKPYLYAALALVLGVAIGHFVK